MTKICGVTFAPLASLRFLRSLSTIFFFSLLMLLLELDWKIGKILEVLWDSVVEIRDFSLWEI